MRPAPAPQRTCLGLGAPRPRRKSSKRFLFSCLAGPLGDGRRVVKRFPTPLGGPPAGGGHAAGGRKTTPRAPPSTPTPPSPTTPMSRSAVSRRVPGVDNFPRHPQEAPGPYQLWLPSAASSSTCLCQGFRHQECRSVCGSSDSPDSSSFRPSQAVPPVQNIFCHDLVLAPFKLQPITSSKKSSSMHPKLNQCPSYLVLQYHGPISLSITAFSTL